jgi:hypothetical protein
MRCAYWPYVLLSGILAIIRLFFARTWPYIIPLNEQVAEAQLPFV